MNDSGVPTPVGGPSPEQRRMLQEIATPLPAQHPLAEKLSEAIAQWKANPALTAPLDRLLTLVKENHEKIHALESGQVELEKKIHELTNRLAAKEDKAPRYRGKPDDRDDGS